ncbi:MAG: enoyl-CoA hydratase/isomerase family protein [Gammaproteobacteria bacterium]|nr:enoyl-CoA hydratase/isomerase family protein [Gammaproteobacteria bacterium]MCP5459557.1 enoyl-CoA hydratase/isomerase family protein [Gammaproteobacteria bacterium]
MTEQTVLCDYESDRGIATLILNRPELHNAFDDTLISTLTQELVRLDADPDVRLVVLGANGRSFSAGADLNWMRRMADYSYEQNLADARQLAELMRALNAMCKPTVAKVQGAALGGGVGLVACCDIAVATRTASFALSEVRLGLIPAVISPYVVAAIGGRQARRYFLSAERFDAAEAFRIGLVHQVVESADLDATVNAHCQTLLNNSPAALAAAKDLIRAVDGQPVEHALIEDTATRIARIRASSEGREGVSAFLEKRRPSWIIR